MRVITAQARSDSPNSCISSGSSSCGSGLWNADRLDTADEGAVYSTMNSNNVNDPEKLINDSQRTTEETNDSKPSSLEESRESKAKDVMMFSNPFDFK